jgi:hypothetical protein
MHTLEYWKNNGPTAVSRNLLFSFIKVQVRFPETKDEVPQFFKDIEELNPSFSPSRGSGPTSATRTAGPSTQVPQVTARFRGSGTICFERSISADYFTELSLGPLADRIFNTIISLGPLADRIFNTIIESDAFDIEDPDTLDEICVEDDILEFITEHVQNGMAGWDDYEADGPDFDYGDCNVTDHSPEYYDMEITDREWTGDFSSFVTYMEERLQTYVSQHHQQ